MSLPKIYPDGSIILVKPDQLGEQVGRIIIPDVARENEKFVNTTGSLVKIGAAADFCIYVERQLEGAYRFKKLTITPEMLPLRVCFPKSAGITIYDDTDEGRVEYKLMLEGDIVAFLEEPEWTEPGEPKEAASVD